MPRYRIRAAAVRPELAGQWDGPAWSRADIVELACFRPEGSSHRPKTEAKLLYDRTGIFGIFRVEDRFVRCRHTGYAASVYKDSCVELFLLPRQAEGYLNFEFNCGGAQLGNYIIDPERQAGGFRNFVRLTEEDMAQLALYHSLPEIVEPEIAGPVQWLLEFFIPFRLIEKYAGLPAMRRNKAWRANFYKCGDETSHPHWASWTPLPEKNFHRPDCFGEIVFEEQHLQDAPEQVSI